MSTPNPSQAIAAALARSIPDNRIAETIASCLSATMTDRSGTVSPDHRTRLAAAQLALAYLVGRPVERQEVVTVSLDADSALGLRERLAHSPALRQTLRGALRDVDAPEG
jgi:hypothetical protein